MLPQCCRLELAKDLILFKRPPPAGSAPTLPSVAVTSVRVLWPSTYWYWG
jgi:hypothetical protein